MSVIHDHLAVVSARMDPDLRAELARRALEEDRTLSGAIRHAVKLYLAYRPAVDERPAQ